MIRINFLKPRKPFKKHEEDYIKKWSMPEKKKVIKLKESDVIFIRRHYAEFGCRQLAEMFKVHPRTIANAAQGITFAHLNLRFRPWA